MERAYLPSILAAYAALVQWLWIQVEMSELTKKDKTKVFHPTFLNTTATN